MINTIRPYEMSIWSLQDSYLATLKTPGIETKGHIQEPKFTLKDDGTQEIEFSIPMYYTLQGERRENPFWYDYKNGLLLVGLRKIKVIFNKHTVNEHVYDFVITEVEEQHDANGLICTVKGEGLAFQELGKIGTQIELSEDDYLNEYNAFFDDTLAAAEANNWDAERTQTELAKAPVNNLQYWADKIFDGTAWTYSIQMDWYAYDGYVIYGPDFSEDLSQYGIVGFGTVNSAQVGIAPENSIMQYSDLTTNQQRDYINQLREQAGLRRCDTIYENDYITAWADGETSLIPTAMEKYKEKYRLFEGSNSNIYNLTQDLAEIFGVFCRYVYHYDNNYHIIGREAIFYNNFLTEQTGHLDITFPYNAKSLTRKIDSNDVCTKLFVESVDDDTTPTGVLTIMDTTANKSRENYILNFDYLYDIGSITQEQYDDITQYEYDMYKFNTQLTPLSEQIASLQQEKIEYEAQKTVAEQSIILDQEQIDHANAALNAITDNRGYVMLTEGNAHRGYLVRQNGMDNSEYKINLSVEGILTELESDPSYKIRMYRKLNGTTLSDEVSVQTQSETAANYVHRDEYNNVDGIYNIYPNDDSRVYYLIFAYRPALKYENIERTHQNKLMGDMADRDDAVAKLEEIENQLEELQAQYDDLLTQKKERITRFNIMMGPALREGSWTPEDYKNYGAKYNETLEMTSDASGVISSDNLQLIYDEVPFDGEQLQYWEESVNRNKLYYPYVDMTNYLTPEEFQNGFNQIAFRCYDEVSQPHRFVIGSQAQLCYMKNGNTVFPALLLTGAKDLVAAEGGMGIVQNQAALTHYVIQSQEDGGGVVEEDIITISNNDIIVPYYVDTTNVSITEGGQAYILKDKQSIQIVEVNNGVITGTAYDINNILRTGVVSGTITAPATLVYPRLQINSLSLKTTPDAIHFMMSDENSITPRELEAYVDYSILLRQESNIEYNGSTIESIEQIDAYFIIPKSSSIINHSTAWKIFTLMYEISNAQLNVYLDALEVSKNNAYPQVSYEVDITLLQRNNDNTHSSFLQHAYAHLGHIVNINDTDLKFKNVLGYISSLTLSLDKPWEDKLEVKNYKNKFEDLFSKIVASTETLSQNIAVYNKAAAAFGTNGILLGNNLQAALDSNDLTFRFRNGNLTLSELGGIEGVSDKGIVAYTDEGIFTAQEKDEDGNWKWNTGITPEGINANLIKAGQLDTNLIKIFAGDNLRLQLNADGLIAYRRLQNGEHNPNQYVIHNEDGLFLVAKAGEIINGTTLVEDVNRVSVSWDGIAIKNLQNEKVFYADENGDLVLSGTITANNGVIGGWNIQNAGLWKNDSNVHAGMATTFLEDNSNLINSSVFKVFWVGTNNALRKFYVDSTGGVNASYLVSDFASLNQTYASQLYLKGVPLHEIIPEVRDANNRLGITKLLGDTYIYDWSSQQYKDDYLRFGIMAFDEAIDFLNPSVSNTLSISIFDQTEDHYIDATTADQLVLFDPITSSKFLTFSLKVDVMNGYPEKLFSVNINCNIGQFQLPLTLFTNSTTGVGSGFLVYIDSDDGRAQRSLGQTNITLTCVIFKNGERVIDEDDLEAYSYQWQKYNESTQQWDNIVNATQRIYKIEEIDVAHSEGNYACLVYLN